MRPADFDRQVAITLGCWVGFVACLGLAALVRAC